MPDPIQPASSPCCRLCKIKFYNNCLFYNVQRNFIAQSGDPTNSGKGGQSIWGVLYGEQVSVRGMLDVCRRKRRAGWRWNACCLGCHLMTSSHAAVDPAFLTALPGSFLRG